MGETMVEGPPVTVSRRAMRRRVERRLRRGGYRLVRVRGQSEKESGPWLIVSATGEVTQRGVVILEENVRNAGVLEKWERLQP